MSHHELWPTRGGCAPADKGAVLQVRTPKPYVLPWAALPGQDRGPLPPLPIADGSEGTWHHVERLPKCKEVWAVPLSSPHLPNHCLAWAKGVRTEPLHLFYTQNIPKE